MYEQKIAIEEKKNYSQGQERRLYVFRREITICKKVWTLAPEL